MRVLLAVLAALFFTGPASALDVATLNRTIDTTNFVVNAGCSGTLIDPEQRLVLTADHCVTQQYETIDREKITDAGVVTKERVRVRRDGKVSRLAFDGPESVKTVTYRVRLLVSDADHDLALVQSVAPFTSGEATVAPHIACELPKRGEQVWIVGNPMAMGMLYSSVTTGIVSSNQRSYEMLGFGDTPTQDKAALMQISGGVVGGNSGGSVWNTAGELVGVPVIAHRTNEVLAFAVPQDVIRAFLTDKGHGRLFAHCGSTQ